jgi:zinc and cadmium transporter
VARAVPRRKARMHAPLMFLFSGISSIGGVAAAALVLAVPAGFRTRAVSSLVSYATGALLGAAFLGVLPEALEHAPASSVTAAVLAGIVLFFVLEKLVLWRHCHDDACEAHRSSGLLIVFGDGLHNFADGVLIAAAFLASVPLGISTALATLVHEIPQETGDFAILLDSGYSRGRALALNVLSALATLVGTAVGYLWLDAARELVPFVLAVSAGSFIYIATADLMPNLHRQVRPAASLQQVALLIAGAATIALVGGHAH